MEGNDLQRELDLTELCRRNAEAGRQEREAGMARPRLWLEIMKWILAAGGLIAAVLELFGGG